MDMITGMRAQLLGQLRASGFVRAKGNIVWMTIKGHFIKGHFTKGHFIKGHFIKGHFIKGHFIKGHFIKGHFIKGLKIVTVVT